jgi:hypothetical protein
VYGTFTYSQVRDLAARLEFVVEDTLSRGGGTYKAADLTPVAPLRMWAVGLQGGTRLPLQSLSSATLAQAFDKVAARSGVGYLGTWVDGDTVYVDPVVLEPDVKVALSLARIHKQRAIYNLHSHETREVEYRVVSQK